MREVLLSQLTALRLRGIADVLEEELARAEREGTPVVDVIERLFAAQIA
jgi:DNA replication protein DnaC